MTDELPRYRFTMDLTQDEAEDIARGIVPRQVQDLVISLLIDVRLSPGDALEGMSRRRRRAKQETK